MLDLWMKIILQIDWKSNTISFPLCSLQSYTFTWLQLYSCMEFASWEKKKSPEFSRCYCGASMQRCAFKSIVCLGRLWRRSQYWLGWENTAWWPTGINCFPLAALFCAPCSCVSVEEQLHAGTFSEKKPYVIHMLSVLKVSSHTRGNNGT